MKSMLVLLGFTTLVAGCAADPDWVRDRGERQTVTGSNVPRRAGSLPAGVDVYDREAFERERDRVQARPPADKSGGGIPGSR